MSGAGLPCILRATANFVYVRLHGPDPGALYGGSYTAEDLRWWAERKPPWPTADAFVVASVNARATNTSDADAAGAIGRVHADVLVIVEYTPALRAQLERRGVLARYANRVEDPRDGFFGSAIYSRFPIAGHDVLHLAGVTMASNKIPIAIGLSIHASEASNDF